MSRYPQPMPATGERPLTGAQAAARARQLACLRRKESTQCQGQVHINLFFDGTGNKHDWNGAFDWVTPTNDRTQRQRNGHSNIARLWDVAWHEPENGISSIYIPGVGTPFKEIDDDSTTLGAAMALNGANRINWGIIQVYNAIHFYLTGAKLIDDSRAKTIVNNMSSVLKSLGAEGMYRRLVLRTWEEKLAAVIKNHQRKVLGVTLNVFGFSRGAAQARAFCHWLYEIAKMNNDGCGGVIAGVPLRFQFLGLFDTVASVGFTGMLSSAAEGKMAWADGHMMSIHSAVERCSHYVALHEQRINFPLDLASGGQVKEVLYPGVHSDVGGGYSPGSHGRSPAEPGVTPQLSQIPLVDMHHDAFQAGVLLRSMNEIRSSPWRKSFRCSTTTIARFNDWLQGHGIRATDTRNCIRLHTLQYVKWRLERCGSGDRNYQAQAFFTSTSGRERIALARAQDDFKRRYQIQHDYDARAKDSAFMRPRLMPDGSYRAPQIPCLSAEGAEIYRRINAIPPNPASSNRLFDTVVHDSVGMFFLRSYNEYNFPGFKTEGYFRYRGVFNVVGRARSGQCDSPG